MALNEQPENQTHSLGFNQIDLEPLLNARTTLIDRDRPVAVRRARFVPEALARIWTMMK